MKNLIFICSLALSLCACSSGSGSGGSAQGVKKGSEQSDIERCLGNLSIVQNLEIAVAAGYRMKTCGYSEDRASEIAR